MQLLDLFIWMILRTRNGLLENSFIQQLDFVSCCLQCNFLFLIGGPSDLLFEVCKRCPNLLSLEQIIRQILLHPIKSPCDLLKIKEITSIVESDNIFK